MLASFNDNKSMLKQQLQDIPWSIYFSFDLWTSTNRLAILGIVGHWISMHVEIQQGLLAMKKIEGAHSGDNQAALILHMLSDYQLYDKVGYFTLDNATSNDSTLRIVGLKLQELGIKFDYQERRLRCFGHIINLVVKAFLYVVDTTNTESLDREKGKEADLLFEYWRQRGPYSRLRNIITYICWTPQRREEFIHLTRESCPDTTAFLPIAANQTRWNSDYRAINRALELRTPIELFVTRHMREGLSNYQLDTEDWNDLKDISELLEPFYRTTKLLEGMFFN